MLFTAIDLAHLTLTLTRNPIPLQEELQTVCGGVDEIEGFWEPEFSTGLSVEGHHLITVPHPGLKCGSALLNLRHRTETNTPSLFFRGLSLFVKTVVVLVASKYIRSHKKYQ